MPLTAAVQGLDIRACKRGAQSLLGVGCSDRREHLLDVVKRDFISDLGCGKALDPGRIVEWIAKKEEETFLL